MSHRPATPSEVARILRKECNFGCCVCGNPIVQYHHIVPWEKEHHFRSGDMMCLCPNHHDEATKGAMIETRQRSYKKLPYNVQRGYSKGLLTINHSVPIVKIGSCNFIGDGNFISVDGYNLLALKSEDGILYVSLKLYDENGKLILELNDNEWISGEIQPWDIKASYQHLKVWNAKRDIGLEIATDVIPIDIKARLIYKNQSFYFSPDRIFFNGAVKAITIINMSLIGMKLNASLERNALEIQPNIPGRDGTIMSGTDINQGIEIWNRSLLQN